MEILQWIGIFIAALSILLISADQFTSASEKIGLHFKIPAFIIGVTIVALGTSLPELITSIIAVMKGESGIVIGNVVGSNIANILLIIGITAIVSKKIVVDKDILSIDLPILLGSTLLIYFSALDNKITYIEGIIFVIGLLIYIAYNIQTHRSIGEKEINAIRKLKREVAKEEKKDKLNIKYPLILIVSVVVLYFSADWTIKAVIELGTMLKISTEILAITAIAIGTSLPELVVSTIAAIKGKADIAIGNVMGSNIFNALGVMGISSLTGNLAISNEAVSFSIPAMILITVLFVFVSMDKTISKWEGATMVLIYITFIGKIIGII